jgi:hypothetical protein
VREYLEIDLSRNHLITLTETQGRFGNGQGQEYAEGFLIEYWRDTLNQWVVYNENGTKVSDPEGFFHYQRIFFTFHYEGDGVFKNISEMAT